MLRTRGAALLGAPCKQKPDTEVEALGSPRHSSTKEGDEPQSTSRTGVWGKVNKGNLKDKKAACQDSHSLMNLTTLCLVWAQAHG